jgi:hypothetical protein
VVLGSRRLDAVGSLGAPFAMAAAFGRRPV